MWSKRRLKTASATVELDRIPAKQRPRLDTRSGRVYTPRDTARAEALIAKAWREQAGAMASHEGEVHLCIQIERPLAKSNPRKWEGRADTMKPDLDNTAKLVCDALNGVAWKDDSQVTRLLAVRLPRPPHREKVLLRIEAEYFEEVWT